MKIGFDVAQTCSERAGCAWYSDSIVRAMVMIAPEHEFFLYHQFGSWNNPSTEAGTHIAAPNVTNTFTDVTPAEAARIWLSPDELLIKTGAPDIVHATSFRAPKVPGAKLVFTVYDVSFWAVPHFTTEENRLTCQEGILQSLQNADGFVFISQSAHDEFERFLPGWLEESRRPWAVTPLAPRDSIGKAAAATASQDRYFLAIGSIEPRKNYDTLLDALELYWTQSKQPAPLWIAGGGGWRSTDLRKRLAGMEARGLVHYLGYIPDEKLGDLVATARALIFPSWYEGFGLPVLEAMTLGCPVICSNRTSLPEVGGDAPIYVDPASAPEIAHAMCLLESSGDARSRCTNAGLSQASKFSWHRTATLTLNFYAKLHV